MERTFPTNHGEPALSLQLPDAMLAWWPHWLPVEQADALFAQLRASIPWSVHRIRLFGREVDSPRLSAWLGDAGAGYAYSGAHFAPHPWSPTLQTLRAQVESACGTHFNSVLANLYRDGNDSMGWHSDDERELGCMPVIASLSLGTERLFRMRRKRARGTPRQPGDTLDLRLPHGSLLRMAGATQQNYCHAIPKSRRVQGARINLTFRQII